MMDKIYHLMSIKMVTLKRILVCLLVLAVVFGSWYVADPQMALFAGASHENVKANANPTLYRLVVYTTYVMAVAITWICSIPAGRASAKAPCQKITKDYEVYQPCK